MTIDVSILIVSYNTSAMTVACLESLLGRPTAASMEVVVVDNASSDDTVSMIRKRFPSVVLVESRENLGFARGVNLAASRASGEHLLLLNPDAEVVEDAIDKLLAFARARPEFGVYGGRTIRPDGSLDPHSCWGAPTPWSLLCFGLGLSTAFRDSSLFDPESLGRWQRDSVREVGVVTGCLLLVRADTFARLGGLDPRYFMYSEDVDFSMRARKAGLRPVITPDATVMHHSGASSDGNANKFILVMAGKVTLIRTHWTGGRQMFGLAMLWLGVALRAWLSQAATRGSGKAAAPKFWVEVRRRRREWWRGYVDPGSPGPARRSPS